MDGYRIPSYGTTIRGAAPRAGPSSLLIYAYIHILLCSLYLYTYSRVSTWRCFITTTRAVSSLHIARVLDDASFSPRIAPHRRRRRRLKDGPLRLYTSQAR